MIIISYGNKEPSRKEKTTTSRAIKRYSASNMKSQKIQNLGTTPSWSGCAQYTEWTQATQKCLSKLKYVKSNKNKSGRSEKRRQRIRIAQFIPIRGRLRQVNVRKVKCWASKGAKTVTKWSSQSSAAAAKASPVITLTNSY